MEQAAQPAGREPADPDTSSREYGPWAGWAAMGCTLALLLAPTLLGGLVPPSSRGFLFFLGVFMGAVAISVRWRGARKVDVGGALAVGFSLSLFILDPLLMWIGVIVLGGPSLVAAWVIQRKVQAARDSRS